jgi:hypothetical protein
VPGADGLLPPRRRRRSIPPPPHRRPRPVLSAAGLASVRGGLALVVLPAAGPAGKQRAGLALPGCRRGGCDPIPRDRLPSASPPARDQPRALQQRLVRISTCVGRLASFQPSPDRAPRRAVPLRAVAEARRPRPRRGRRGSRPPRPRPRKLASGCAQPGHVYRWIRTIGASGATLAPPNTRIQPQTTTPPGTRNPQRSAKSATSRKQPQAPDRTHNPPGGASNPPRPIQTSLALDSELDYGVQRRQLVLVLGVPFDSREGPL